MGRSAILVAMWVLAAATAARAQVTGVVTNGSVTVSDPYDGVSVNGPVGNSAQEYGFPNTVSQAIENYQVSASVTSSSIDFADNVTSQGEQSSTSATTSVAVTYKNGGASKVTASLKSMILPGGFGFYMDDPAGNPTLSGTLVGDVNQTPLSSVGAFTNISGYSTSLPAASAGFTYEIMSGSKVLKSYSSSVDMYLSAGPGGFGLQFTVVPASNPGLRGFAALTAAASNQAVAYQWDATNVNLSLGTLDPLQSSTLTFVSTVTTTTFDLNNLGGSSNGCTVQYLCPQILAYSGFGDPIGKSLGPGQDPYFPVFQESLPTFDPTTGILEGPMVQAVLPSLPLAGVTPPANPPTIPKSVLSAVPEPEAWTLMLAGLALVGLALRTAGSHRST